MEATAYDGPTPTPGVPTNLAATPGDSQVTLSWEAPSTGASAITGYEYQYSTTTVVLSAAHGPTVTGTGTTVTVSSLTGATTYFFRVRAVNAQRGRDTFLRNGGHSLRWANPDAGSNHKSGGHFPGDGQVTLNWVAPSVGASVITHYEYQYSTTSRTFDATHGPTLLERKRHRLQSDGGHHLLFSSASCECTREPGYLPQKLRPSAHDGSNR